MILVDANLLVYAANLDAPEHDAAHAWLDDCLNGPDADLAALAIEHGLTLCSSAGDFARFPGLKWENPLGPSAER